MIVNYFLFMIISIDNYNMPTEHKCCLCEGASATCAKTHSRHRVEIKIAHALFVLLC
jgi:hypothetical protein